MPEIKTAVTERCRMRYFCFGQGERPVLLIPGVSIKSVMESAAAMRYAYKILEREHTVYVPDRREDIPEDFTVWDMAEDMAAAMDKLGISGAYVIGISQGGMIAQVLAARYPERVKKLVLASTAPRSNAVSDDLFDRAEELAAAGKSSELNLLFAERIFSAEFFERFRDVIEGSSAAITAEDLQRFSRMSSHMKDFDIGSELDRISCETLVIVGSEDRVFGTEPSRELAQRLGCELCVFEGHGHAVYDETDSFKEKCYEFFIR